MAEKTRETPDTRIGRLEFTPEFASGCSTGETVTGLFDEIDFQRACQAYHPVILQDFKKAEW